jgi:hypothetical protein
MKWEMGQGFRKREMGARSRKRERRENFKDGGRGGRE